MIALWLGCLSLGVSEAQAPARPKRIGVLSSGSMSAESAIVGLIHQWSFRGDVAFEYQPRDRDDRLPALAVELVSLKVDLIPSRYFVQPSQNGLMSYGPSAIDIGRRVASHIDRILKGAVPSELPVEQPSQFDLVVNLRTASTLGVRFPKSLLEQVHRAFD